MLQSVFITTPSRVEQLEENLITAITYRSSNIDLYAKLTRDLVSRASSNNSLSLFKGLIMKTLHIFLNGEIIFPVECVDLPFIYKLTENGALTIEEAVDNLGKYAEDTAMCIESLCWIFVWFAPEIEIHNPQLFLKLAEILERESRADSLFPTFQLFVAHLPELRKDNWRLLKESLFLSLDAVPENIDIKTIEQILTQAPGIEGWHHLHIWAVSTTENAATVHIVISNLLQMEEIKWNLKNELRKKGIQHTTIECETPDSLCKDRDCC